jgi:hypothetical protein
MTQDRSYREVQYLRHEAARCRDMASNSLDEINAERLHAMAENYDGEALVLLRQKWRSI